MPSWELYVRLNKTEYDDVDGLARNQKLSAELASDNRSIQKIELDKDGSVRGWWVVLGSPPDAGD